MTRGLYWAELSSWSLAPMAYDCIFPSKAPLAWLTLAAPTAARMSARESPYEARATGLTCTRTAGFWPPLMLTSPTPGSWLIFCARRVSANSSTLGRDRVSEERARVRMGASAGFVLE